MMMLLKPAPRVRTPTTRFLLKTANLGVKVKFKFKIKCKIRVSRVIRVSIRG